MEDKTKRDKWDESEATIGPDNEERDLFKDEEGSKVEASARSR